MKIMEHGAYAAFKGTSDGLINGSSVNKSTDTYYVIQESGFNWVNKIFYKISFFFSLVSESKIAFKALKTVQCEDTSAYKQHHRYLQPSRPQRSFHSSPPPLLQSSQKNEPQNPLQQPKNSILARLKERNQLHGAGKIGPVRFNG
ncbi:MAG: hypothetical protein K940chlam5_00494 [Candidatus Anoxychlamydiales bacterium]|nr:hypothetical protein [Candidatus Anoxychlamydiales bacterium]